MNIVLTNNTSSQVCFDPNEAINLDVGQSWKRIEVFSLNAPVCGFADIGRVTLTAPPENQLPTILDVLIGANPDPISLDALDQAGRHWAGLQFNGAQSTALRDRTRLDGRVSGDLTGSIEAGRVGYLWIGGAVDQSVVVGDSTVISGDSFRFGSISSNGSLQSRKKSIVRLEVLGDSHGLIQAGLVFPTDTQSIFDFIVDGSLFGTVEVANELRNLTVDGTIGTPGAPARIGVGVFLNNLTCGELNANIGGFQGASNVDQIHKISVNAPGGSGDFRGTIFSRDLMKFASVPGRIVIGRDMLGTIKTNEGLRLDSNTIDIGSATGLKGRTIIGANSFNNQTWPWDSTVEVGSTLIGPPQIPAYSNSAQSLGGGAIGLMPFRLHSADSSPLDESCVERVNAPSDTAPIHMRNYGAVTVLAGDGNPFILERRAIGATGGWIDQSTCTSQLVDSNPTIVRVAPSATGTRLQAGYEYRVRQAKKRSA